MQYESCFLSFLLITEIADYHYEENEAIKEPKYALISNEVIPYYMVRLDAQVKENGGYFVGGNLTWVDLAFVALVDYLNYMARFDTTQKYPSLKALQKKVLALPKIKSWVEKRPKTDH